MSCCTSSCQNTARCSANQQPTSRPGNGSLGRVGRSVGSRSARRAGGTTNPRPAATLKLVSPRDARVGACTLVNRALGSFCARQADLAPVNAHVGVAAVSTVNL